MYLPNITYTGETISGRSSLLAEEPFHQVVGLVHCNLMFQTVNKRFKASYCLSLIMIDNDICIRVIQC